MEVKVKEKYALINHLYHCRLTACSHVQHMEDREHVFVAVQLQRHFVDPVFYFYSISFSSTNQGGIERYRDLETEQTRMAGKMAQLADELKRIKAKKWENGLSLVPHNEQSADITVLLRRGARGSMFSHYKSKRG